MLERGAALPTTPSRGIVTAEPKLMAVPDRQARMRLVAAIAVLALARAARVGFIRIKFPTTSRNFLFSNQIFPRNSSDARRAAIHR
jgi:hypothetical protein